MSMWISGGRVFRLCCLLLVVAANACGDDITAPAIDTQAASTDVEGGRDGGSKVAVDAADVASSPGQDAQSDVSTDASIVRRPHVIIVSLDGCRPDAWAVAGARNLLAFAGEWARAEKAQTIELSLTLPSHTSMLTGVNSDVHGLTWNSPEAFAHFVTVDTVFSIATSAGLRTAAVVGKEKLFALARPWTIGHFEVAVNDDDEVARNAIDLIRDNSWDLLFVHFPNPDLTGHAYGWMSPQYLEKVAHNDVLFGKLRDAASKDTTIIVTADHGGDESGHGSNSDIHRGIPWVIGGPHIRKGYTVKRVVNTVDTAATALHVLGLALPSSATGRVVDEAFDSTFVPPTP